MSRETKKIQPIIASFFGEPPKYVTEIECIGHGGEQKQCYYCGGLFTPQGLPTHEAAHTRREHLKITSRANQSGRVKVNGTIYAKFDKTSDVQDKSLSTDER